jgi:hypothetical protein
MVGTLLVQVLVAFSVAHTAFALGSLEDRNLPDAGKAPILVGDQPEEDSAKSIDGKWELVSIDDTPSPEPHETIFFHKGRLSLHLDCNWHEFEYVVTGDQISARSTGIATEMACKPSEQYPVEREILNDTLRHAQIEQDGAWIRLRPIDRYVHAKQLELKRVSE